VRWEVVRLVLEFLGFSEQNRNPPSRRTARRGKRNLKDFSLICFVECEDYWDPSWHKDLVSRRIEPVDSGLLSGRNTT
jgi:hypothetical protein